MFEQYNFDKRIVPYWEHFGLTEKDFYCRECGNLMLNFDEIGPIRFRKNCELNSNIVTNPKTNTRYVESENNRWLVTGRTLSGKTYFRHLCWECFYKHIGEIEDVPRRARKSSWYKDINNGIFRPPAKCSSPSKYFKLLFDITDEELEREHKKFDTASLESFIRRHGEIEGPKKYEEYKKRQAYTCSKEYMINEKGMTEDEWNKFNANRACTRDNFIKRYGEELGNKKWNEYCKLESYAGCKIEYFIEKYGEIEGSKKYLEVNKQKYQCLENYIRKYGEEDGKKRWALYGNKPFSRISQNLFDALDNTLSGDVLEKSRYFTKNGEAYIKSEKYNRGFHPDYLYENKIIEFNGDYWHCNPKMYKDTEEVEFHGVTKMVKYVWMEDAERKDIMEKMGYNVKVVWENDYVKNPEKILGECVEFLKS